MTHRLQTHLLTVLAPVLSGLEEDYSLSSVLLKVHPLSHQISARSSTFILFCRINYIYRLSDSDLVEVGEGQVPVEEHAPQLQGLFSLEWDS